MKAERSGSSSGWASEKIRVSASGCIGGRDSDAGMVDEPLSGGLDATMANARGRNFSPPMTLANMRRNSVRCNVRSLRARG